MFLWVKETRQLESTKFVLPHPPPPSPPPQSLKPPNQVLDSRFWSLDYRPFFLIIVTLVDDGFNKRTQPQVLHLNKLLLPHDKLSSAEWTAIGEEHTKEQGSASEEEESMRCVSSFLQLAGVSKSKPKAKPRATTGMRRGRAAKATSTTPGRS